MKKIFDTLLVIRSYMRALIRCAWPARSARGPAFTDTLTYYDWLYVGKCTDAVCYTVYISRYILYICVGQSKTINL